MGFQIDASQLQAQDAGILVLPVLEFRAWEAKHCATQQQFHAETAKCTYNEQPTTQQRQDLRGRIRSAALHSTPAWTPEVCRMIAFLVVCRGLGYCLAFFGGFSGAEPKGLHLLCIFHRALGLVKFGHGQSWLKLTASSFSDVDHHCGQPCLASFPRYPTHHEIPRTEPMADALYSGVLVPPGKQATHFPHNSSYDIDLFQDFH